MTVFLNRRQFVAATGAAIAVPVSATTLAATPVQHHVDIKSFRFDPKVVTVRPGDTIVWHNHDIAPHTATALDGSWDTGKLERGETHSMPVGKAMSGEFFCRFHPAMKGRIELGR